MFTRCPGCHAIHSVNAALLAQGNGLYRCGRCSKVSNALQNLFDDWPEAGEAPASGQSAERQPPVLGDAERPRSSPRGEATTREAATDEDAEAREWATEDNRSRRVWAAAAVVLAAVTLLNLFFVSGDALLAQPSIRAALEGIGAVDPPPESVYRDLSRLHLASSEMHSHPTLDETLVLNATIVNRADRAQPFPALQITLFDAQNQPLASRIFAPEEYLPPGTAMDSGMPPAAYLPVIMELLDPGDHAVGFEMKFH